MKRWSYKISVRDINNGYKGVLPFNFEYSINDIDNLTEDEIKDILIGVSLKRILKQAKITVVFFSFEFGDVNEEFAYTNVYIWVE